MAVSWKDVAARVRALLSEEERRSGAAYLDERVLPPGTHIDVDGRPVPTRWPAVVAFVDQQPGANWGHACRYLLLNPETGEVEDVPARSPPFLRGVAPTLKLVWKGESVPDWALACTEEE